MAIFIFTKNSDDVENSIFCIAANQTVLDENKNWDENKYDVLTVSDNDFNEVKLGNKIIKSKNKNIQNIFDKSCSRGPLTTPQTHPR